MVLRAFVGQRSWRGYGVSNASEKVPWWWIYYSDVTWLLRYLKSPATRFFVKQLSMFWSTTKTTSNLCIIGLCDRNKPLDSLQKGIAMRKAFSGTDQRKHQSSASLAFVRGIHRWPVDSPHKGPGTPNMFHLMTSSCHDHSVLHTADGRRVEALSVVSHEQGLDLLSFTGTILCMRPTSERWCYNVISLGGRIHKWPLHFSADALYFIETCGWHKCLISHIFLNKRTG